MTREYTLNPDGSLRLLTPSRVRTLPVGAGGSALLIARGDVDLDAISDVVTRALAPQGATVPGEFCKAPAPEPLPPGAPEGRSMRDMLLEAVEKVRALPAPRPEPIVLPKAMFEVYARAFADATGTDWERHVVGLRALAAHAVSDSAHDDARTAPPVRAQAVRTARTDERAHAHDPLAVFVLHAARDAAPPAMVEAPPMRTPVRFVGGPIHGRTGHALTTVDDAMREVPPRFVGVPVPFEGWADPSTVQVYVRKRLLDCGAWAFEWRPAERAGFRQVLHRRDLPDAHVIAHARRGGPIGALETEGVPHNLAYAKVMHLVRRGLLEYGTSPYSAWPTGAGLALAEQHPGRDA
ncbi:hypothetical protein ACFCZ3_20005 [Cellulosimicrobium cellulans]|uniref:hypothetical protein n=1 Tax=Cellulosimicrobium cellulans TaxID=1710 RepID=UPI0035D7F9DA